MIVMNKSNNKKATAERVGDEYKLTFEDGSTKSIKAKTFKNWYVEVEEVQAEEQKEVEAVFNEEPQAPEVQPEPEVTPEPEAQPADVAPAPEATPAPEAQPEGTKKRERKPKGEQAPKAPKADDDKLQPEKVTDDKYKTETYKGANWSFSRTLDLKGNFIRASFTFEGEAVKLKVPSKKNVIAFLAEKGIQVKF